MCKFLPGKKTKGRWRALLVCSCIVRSGWRLMRGTQIVCGSKSLRQNLPCDGGTGSSQCASTDGWTGLSPYLTQSVAEYSKKPGWMRQQQMSSASFEDILPNATVHDTAPPVYGQLASCRESGALGWQSAGCEQNGGTSTWKILWRLRGQKSRSWRLRMKFHGNLMTGGEQRIFLRDASVAIMRGYPCIPFGRQHKRF